MKIEIDTTNKVIQVKEQINIKEFFNELKKIIPDYEDYSIMVPIQYYPYNPTYTPPNYPNPFITYTSGDNTLMTYDSEGNLSSNFGTNFVK